MKTTSCPDCGQPKNPNARQCWECSNKTRRARLKGVRHGDERRQKISDGKRRQIARDGKVFDLAAHMREKPHPFALPVGTERVVKDGRVMVKCEDGKWRYRSRVMWEAANGPIPRGLLIHHRNFDPMDDRLENFQMLTISEHRKIHAAATPPEELRRRQRLTVEARKRNGTY